MRKLNWRQIVSYLGIWILIAVFFSALLYISVSHVSPENPPTWKNIFLWQAIIYGWAILFPLIRWVGERFRVEKSNWRRMVPLHLALAIFFIAAHGLVYLVFYHLFVGFNEESRFLAALGKHIVTNWGYDGSMYFLILSAVTAHDYSRRFQAEQLKSSELNAALADSQLSALKMQLHPHFLFNTLNSISSLMHEDVRAADEMLARLGDFLRLTLENSGEQVVALSQEMDFINRYLEIESVRFGERLTVERDIEPETLQAQVPNLILQPLIENAIKHGISRQIRPGKICIRAKRAGEKLRLQVEDDGPGLQNGTGASHGIGLANTRARLLNLYDSNQRVEITAAEPQGLTVTVEIPFEIEKKLPSNERHSYQSVNS